MLVIAVVLTVATFAGVMTPWLLLLLTLGLSIGDAVESPTWRAIFPELVEQGGVTRRSGSEWDRVQSGSGRRAGPRRLHCRICRRGRCICIQCPLLLRCHRRDQEMEEAGAKEHIACRDLPGSDLRCHSLCPVFPGYSQAAASVGSSYLFHEFLLGAPANRGAGNSVKAQSPTDSCSGPSDWARCWAPWCCSGPGRSSRRRLCCLPPQRHSPQLS